MTPENIPSLEPKKHWTSAEIITAFAKQLTEKMISFSKRSLNWQPPQGQQGKINFPEQKQ